MLTEQRYQIILDLLKEKKSVTATELKEILDTSESTVRRDITALHKAGKLIKVFGGAVALEDEGTVSAYEPTVEQKSELYVKEKRKIAQYAAELIEEEDFIYLDAGTTTGYMIDALGYTNAVFVTNAVSHAQRLAAKGIKVFLIYRGSDRCPGNEESAGISFYQRILWSKWNHKSRRIHDTGCE